MTEDVKLSLDKGIVELPNGRKVSFSIYGCENGKELLFCHGVNGTRIQASLFESVAYKLGLKIITPDRPGYGESTPVLKRDYMDWADDIQMFLDKLGIKKCGILGLSAGGNYALACLFKYPKYFSKAVMVSSASGAFKSRKGPERMLADFLLKHPSYISIYLGFMFKLNNSAKKMKYMIQKLGMSDSDIELFEKMDIASLITLTEKEAYINGSEVPASDVTRAIQDVDFDLSKITIPVKFWYGGQDRVVPANVARIVEKLIPNVEIIIKEDAGHMLIFQYLGEILQEFVK